MTTPPTTVRIAFADCFSGISGDMLLGALLHAGLDAGLLTDQLAGLRLPGLVMTTEPQTLQGIGCLKVRVNGDRRRELQTLPAILGLLEESSLEDEVITRASAVFRNLARAEAKVHALAEEQVHFHEVGTLDTLVEVVGSVLGLHHLGIKRLICSPLPLCQGLVQSAEGLMPLPAPAVCELLRGVPTYGVDLREELVTPTGAALLATLSDEFGTLPPMTIRATGYGAGGPTLANNQPNLLRLIIGEATGAAENQLVEVIETNVDDWSPEGFPHLCDLLFARGALDVTLTSILMKKGRPGYALQVICPVALAHPLKETLLSETTAIGLRCRRESRRTLPRERVAVTTRWGEIAAKKVETPTGTVIYPEYEACREVALRHQVPLSAVYDAVRHYGDS